MIEALLFPSEIIRKFVRFSILGILIGWRIITMLIFDFRTHFQILLIVVFIIILIIYIISLMKGKQSSLCHALLLDQVLICIVLSIVGMVAEMKGNGSNLPLGTIFVVVQSSL